MTRHARAVDANHGTIRDALRAAGLTVFDLSGAGDGCPDLCVARAGKTYFLEVKDGSKIPSARKLTPAQVRWHQRASTGGVRVHVVETVEQALAAVGLRIDRGCMECQAGHVEHPSECECGCHVRPPE